MEELMVIHFCILLILIRFLKRKINDKKDNSFIHLRKQICVYETKSVTAYARSDMISHPRSSSMEENCHLFRVSNQTQKNSLFK